MKFYSKISCCFLIAGLFMSLHFHTDASAPKKGMVGKDLTRANALFPRDVHDKNGADLVNGTRTLFIFLDEPKELGAISQDFFKAVYEKPGPILVSASTVFNAFQIKTLGGASEYKKARSAIIDVAKKVKRKIEVSGLLAANKSLTENEVYNVVYNLMLEQFKAEEWLIKVPKAEEGEEIFFLLIPLRYIFDLPEAQEIQKKKKIQTLEELQSVPSFNLDEALGLKVSKMETVKGSSFLKRVGGNSFYDFQSSPSEFAMLMAMKPAGSALIDLCDENTLFIEKGAVGSMTQWNMYLTGHGRSDKFVAGMSINDFKKLLDFLEKKIITKFFAYETCESAGINRQRVYADIKGMIGKTYSFPIIGTGTAEAPAAFKFNCVFHYEPEKGLILSFYPNYKEFVQAVESDRPMRYDQLFLLMSGALYQLISGDIFPAISNFPLMRLPNRPFFQPVIPSLEITEFLATSRSPQAPLNIEAYAKQSLARQVGRSVSALGSGSLLFRQYFCILLDAEFIPFEVQCMKSEFFGSEHAPFMLSTLAGDRFMHIFSRFRTNYSFDLDDALSFFSMFDHIKYSSSKVFLIRELIIQKTDKREEIYWDVLIRLNEDRTSVIQYATTKVENGTRVKDTVEAFVVDRPNKIKNRIDMVDPKFKEDYLAEYSGAIKSIEATYDLERQKRDEIEKTLKAREKDKKAEGHRAALAEARKAAEIADTTRAL